MTQFPEQFKWGAATSAYQIEGASDPSQRGRSVWDDYCDRPATIAGADRGDRACDHYHRLDEDLDLIQRLGVGAYRFSIAWPRVMPEGVGRVSEQGVDFYDRLVDGLLAIGVEPHATLFHWDYPSPLQTRGGWLHADSPEWFARYTHEIVDRLSDRVRFWSTHNEPQCVVHFGHGDATHAPGLRLSIRDQLRVAHNVLLAHGRAVQAARAAAKQPITIGLVVVGHPMLPATNSPADIEAARELMFSANPKDLWNIAWYCDPAIFGRYPQSGLDAYAADAPQLSESDRRVISEPIDYLGLNVYSGDFVRRGADGRPEKLPFPPGQARTMMDWPVTPSALYWSARFMHERYKLPIYFTENGIANTDWVSSDGNVHDPQRTDYTRRHLIELHRAIAEGVDIRGYFHWSLLDNFEWSKGYSRRFGLVHVDFETLKRTPKDSYHWYREVMRTNGASLSNP